MEYCVGSASDILEGKLNVLCQLYDHCLLQTSSLKTAPCIQEKIVIWKLKNENSLCFFILAVHKKPLLEVEIAAICQDALQVHVLS